MIQCTQKKGDKIWEQLKAEAARMGGLGDYPDPAFKPEAFRELCFALQCCDSMPAVTKLVDEIVRYTDGKCPTAAAVRRLAHERNTAPESRSVCPECLGDGFRYTWRVRTRQAQNGQMRSSERAATADEIRDGTIEGLYETTVDCVCRKAAVSA